MLQLKIKPHCLPQENFIKTKAKYAAAVAGLGGGKTWAGTIKSLIMSIENPGIRILVTAPVFKILNDATIPKYHEIFGMVPDYAKFLGGDNPMARLANGGEIIFRSTEKPDNLRGPEIGACHMDEGANSSYYSFQIIQGRLRQRNPKTGETYPCQCWVTTTPKGMNWIYLEFVAQDRPNYELFNWSTRDNPYLPPDYLGQFDYKGKFRAQELEGKFHNLEGECMFDTENLNRILHNVCKDPVDTFGYVRVWKEPLIGAKYVAGADPANEGGGGLSCCVIMSQAGEECVEIHGDMPSDEFAKLCDDWGRKYNNALLAVECNGTVGGSVVERLRNMEYPRLYKRDKDTYGWYTSGFNRSQILENYRIAVNRNQTTIYSREAIGEMHTFVSKSSGKYEHMDRCFDDRVMARAIAWRMLQEKQGHRIGFHSFKRLTGTY
jgi:hypothetical protein